MCNITMPQRINQVLVLFHRCGMWRQDDETASSKKCCNLTYLISYVSFVISIAFGGFLSDDKNERIYLVSAAVTLAIMAVKLAYILWKKEEILAFLQEIRVQSVTDPDEFTKINDKVNRIMKFISCFIVLVFMQCLLAIICLPMFSRERTLPVSVAFPLDWKHSEISYWIAYAYVATGSSVCAIAMMLNPVIWYLMMNCSIKYQILGNQFRNMGWISTTKPTKKTRKTKKITELEKHKLFSNELIGLIKVHQNIQKEINRFKSFFSDLFFAQITTSGVCICGSVYALAFISNENVTETAIYIVFLAYNIFDIFMVMYFGNEITLSSYRLLYCVFESNWMDNSKSYKKCVVVLSEVLKQQHELIIGKLYPLDLETFIAILKLAYSMFNILRNLK